MVKDRLNIIVLHPKGEKTANLDDEPIKDTIDTAKGIAMALKECGHRVNRVEISGRTLETKLRKYDPASWIVFNCCETLDGETSKEAHVAVRLSEMGFEFTGSTAWTLAKSLNKAETKEILRAAGIPTANYQLITSLSDELVVPYPVIVKPVSSDAGIGILAGLSIARNSSEYLIALKHVLNEVGESALVEQFLAGREFNVAVWGNNPPSVLPLAELDFSAIKNVRDRVVGFEAKWDRENILYRDTKVVCPANVDLGLSYRVNRIAREAYEALECRDYARIDVRCDEEGNPYVLEVNPNCGIAEDAGFPRETMAAGYTYAQTIERIAQMAAARLRSRKSSH